MESIVERAEQLAGNELKRVRWTLGINGVLSIALAVLILIWPGISLFALAIVFGAFTAANGVMGLIAAIRGPAISGRGWLVLSSLVSIAFGVAVLVRTDLSALALLYVVGAYAISLGIITIGGGFWLPLNGGQGLAHADGHGLGPVRDRDVREAGRRRARIARADRGV
jgi:uncharacterized membrane protein HdeD (DUF308 family)